MKPRLPDSRLSAANRVIGTRKRLEITCVNQPSVVELPRRDVALPTQALNRFWVYAQAAPSFNHGEVVIK